MSAHRQLTYSTVLRKRAALCYMANLAPERSTQYTGNDMGVSKNDNTTDYASIMPVSIGFD